MNQRIHLTSLSNAIPAKTTRELFAIKERFAKCVSYSDWKKKSNRNRKLGQEVIPHWEIWLIQVKQSQNQIHFKQLFLKQSRFLEKNPLDTRRT